MMTISLSDAGKRFNRDWIFRHFSYKLQQGHSYAITGPNGSGKSTLLQVIGGFLHLNEGSIAYNLQHQPVKAEKIFRSVSLCAPYMELVEEMTVPELLSFHREFKPLLPGTCPADIINIIGLEKETKKQIRYFSSGMKQRVKLAQCIFSDSSVVLLDEPCTNLDAEGIELYKTLIMQYCSSRLVVVSSNDAQEYSFCQNNIPLSRYK